MPQRLWGCLSLDLFSRIHSSLYKLSWEVPINSQLIVHNTKLELYFSLLVSILYEIKTVKNNDIAIKQFVGVALSEHQIKRR